MPLAALRTRGQSRSRHLIAGDPGSEAVSWLHEKFGGWSGRASVAGQSK